MIVEGSELRTSLAVIRHADEIAQLEVYDTPFNGVLFDAGRAFSDDRIGSEHCFACIDVQEVSF